MFKTTNISFFILLVAVVFALYFVLNKTQEKFVELLETTNEVKQKTRSCSQDAINNAVKGYVFTDYRVLNRA